MKNINVDELFKKYKLLSLNIPFEFIIAYEESDEAWGVKNNALQFIYTNQRYHHLITPLPHHKYSLLNPFSHEIELHDKMVMSTGRRIEAIGVLTADSDIATPLCFERMPLFNQKAQVSGIITHIKILDVITPRYFISTEDAGPFTFIPSTDLLTEKEWEVVFLLLIGLSEKEISDKLHRTIRTVKFHKSNIFHKTACSSLIQFKAYAYKKKWQLYIPKIFATSRYIIKI